MCTNVMFKRRKIARRRYDKIYFRKTKDMGFPFLTYNQFMHKKKPQTTTKKKTHPKPQTNKQEE